MRLAQAQSGYAMLAMLALLLSAGTGVLGVAGLSGVEGISLRTVVSTQNTLSQSRQSLLSYAALYPYLYGPGGAGPGHLPCPDTDANDGPDPPCSRQAVSRGRLPRQVSLSGGRYAFSELAEARLGYSVSSRVINNPVNRIVNPSTLAAENFQSSRLALLSSVPYLTENHSARDVSSPVTPTAMLQAIRPVVAAWVISRLKALNADQCLFTLSDLGEPNALQIQRCQQALALAERCGLADRNESISSLYWLLLLSDDLPSDGACSANLMSQLSIELIPVSRHWVYRNKWHQWIGVKAHKDCLSDQLPGCKLVYTPLNDQSSLTSPIDLQFTL